MTENREKRYFESALLQPFSKKAFVNLFFYYLDLFIDGTNS